MWGNRLLSAANLDEHEIIIISPSEMSSEIFPPGHSAQLGPTRHAQISKRMAELLEWIQRGHTLFVTDIGKFPFQIMQSDKTTTPFGVERYSPMDMVVSTSKSGSNVKAIGAPEVVDLLSPYIGSYDVVIKGNAIHPLAVVKTTKHTTGAADIVAGYFHVGSGLVIFIPSWLDNWAYWKSLTKLPSILRREQPALPDWVDDYRTSTDVEMFEHLDRRAAEIVKLRDEVANLQSEIAEHRQLKALFSASGTQFEEIVHDALAELGFQIVMGPHPRADLLAVNHARVAAIEAKGIEGAAKEEHVRQVTMWMPEVDAALATLAETDPDPVIENYKEKLRGLDLSNRDADLDCKGISVLGTFRSVPLDQRPSESFNMNISQVLIRRDVCALTGLQLYCMVMKARTNPALKRDFRTAIMQAKGVLDMATDWAEVLAPRSKAGE